MNMGAYENDHGSYIHGGGTSTSVSKTNGNAALQMCGVSASSYSNANATSPTLSLQSSSTLMAGCQCRYSSVVQPNYNVQNFKQISSIEPKLMHFNSQISFISDDDSDNSDDSLHLNVPVREDTSPPCGEDVSTVVEEIPTSASGVVNDDDSDLNEPIDIQIRNVVCNFTVPLHVDLHKVALNSTNVTFDRGRGVLLKQKRNPSCYVKIYSSGKVYIVGCRSEQECKHAARSVARMVQKHMGRLKDIVRIRNYRICNVLATCKMPFGIKIEELAQKYPDSSQYEPELLVGMIWRSVEPKATLRIHTTGSITITGAASEADVMRAVEIIYPIVKEFRCPFRLRDGSSNKRQRQQRKRTYGPSCSSLLAKRTNNFASSSGVIGNRVYFSDEDDCNDGEC